MSRVRDAMREREENPPAPEPDEEEENPAQEPPQDDADA